MAKKNKKEQKNSPSVGALKQETLKAVWSIVFFVISLFLILAAFNKAGFVGLSVYDSLYWLVGIGYYLLPVVFVMLGVSFLKIEKGHFITLRVVGSVLFFLSGLGVVNLLTDEKGGVVGHIVSSPLLQLFDMTASLIILSAIIIISLLIIFDAHITWESFMSLFEKSEGDAFDEPKQKELKIKVGGVEVTGDEEMEEEKTPKEKKKNAEKEIPQKAPEKDIEPKIRQPDKQKDFEGMTIGYSSATGREYTPPPMSLLERDKGKPGVGDIKANANIIKRTLQNFGINVEMDEISIGPSVTRYSLKPAEGVKLSRIVGLQNDLALALAAHPIRIEAPIPGKSLVGIEIPNSTKTTVGLGTLLMSEEFQTSEKPLLVSLGKGISGKAHFGNLAKMPHLLIAGTTGSGKSVTIHAIIASLLYRGGPENLKFIMIDPKRVELTLYNKIPQLLTPVITEPKKAILALKWAAKEMDRRYDILETESVRDIESYHKNVLAPAVKKLSEKKDASDAGGPENKAMPETMPYIVIIIDELADIMTTYPRELEAAIVRLAQMSRAVGIHLILSTQRPSVNVITGLIKANVPSRLALQVSSQIDSRTILDTGGAEKLLGAGDMLFLSGEMSKPQRIQCAYISETEVKNVVKYLIDSYKDELPQEINLGTTEHEKNAIFSDDVAGGDGDLGDDDPLYEEAKEIVMKAGKASTSYLQRKLKVGYSRAARLVDMMEERGVISGADGAKPREVIGSDSSDSVDDGVPEEIGEDPALS